MAATIELPGVDFGALAKEVIAVKLTEALATSEKGLTQIVHAALGVRVNAENGQPPRYSSDPAVPWVEYVAADLIRSATKEVLKQKVDSMRPAIEKAVEAELKRATKTIAVALVEAYANEAKAGYRVSVNMAFQSAK